MLGNTNSISGSGGGSETYQADLVLKGVAEGLPQPTEEEVINATKPILYDIINGTIGSISQTVTPTLDKEGYLYTIIARWTASNQMMPIIYDGVNVTVLDVVENDNRVNGASLSSGGKWVLTEAQDGAENMVYLTVGGALNAQMSYTKALQINWDEGHLVDGHASVTTSRFSLSNGVITDTYTGEILPL